MPKNPKPIRANDVGDATTALTQAATAIAGAQGPGMMPAVNTVLPLDDADGIYQKLNEAKREIDIALSALGGKPCGGGRPC